MIYKASATRQYRRVSIEPRGRPSGNNGNSLTSLSGPHDGNSGYDHEPGKEKRMGALGFEPRTYGLKVLESLRDYSAKTGTNRDYKNGAQSNAHHFEGSISDLSIELHQILSDEQVKRLVDLLQKQLKLDLKLGLQ